MDRSIVVTGATGRQGGAVVEHLLRSSGSFRVRALTRNPNSVRSRGLAERGVDVVAGNLNDRESLDRALAGAYGVFAVQNFWEHGPDAEVRQGKLLGNAAKAAGIAHFVYTSVGAAERNTGVTHYETKWQIEEYLRELSLPLTVLRPVFFMDLFNDPKYPAPAAWSLLASALGNEKKLQMVAVDDIGSVAALAFARPDEYIGQAVELAGDELTIPQAAAAYRNIVGRSPCYLSIPTWPVGLLNRHAGIGIRWLRAEGWHTNIAQARARHPNLHTFERWLLSQKIGQTSKRRKRSNPTKLLQG